MPGLCAWRGGHGQVASHEVFDEAMAEADVDVVGEMARRGKLLGKTRLAGTSARAKKRSRGSLMPFP